MQSDLDLLELAAQSIGEQFHSGHITQNGKQYEWVEWNPLTDDGDALRLAVKLRMMLDDIRQGYQAGCVVAVVGDACCYEPREPDPYAATRRAIVRAAAKIGAQPHPDHKDGGANG